MSKPETTKRLRALRHSQQAPEATEEGTEESKVHDGQCGDVSTDTSDPGVPTATRVHPTNCQEDWYMHSFVELETF